jgi:hypothetical protein
MIRTCVWISILRAALYVPADYLHVSVKQTATNRFQTSNGPNILYTAIRIEQWLISAHQELCSIRIRKHVQLILIQVRYISSFIYIFIIIWWTLFNKTKSMLFCSVDQTCLERLWNATIFQWLKPIYRSKKYFWAIIATRI